MLFWAQRPRRFGVRRKRSGDFDRHPACDCFGATLNVQSPNRRSLRASRLQSGVGFSGEQRETGQLLAFASDACYIEIMSFRPESQRSARPF